MLLFCLWHHRRKFIAFSRDWLKQLAKRALHAPRLVILECRLASLRRRQAKLELPLFISQCILNGPLRNLRIGAGSFIGRAELHLHNPIHIGRNVIINDGVRVLTATHDVHHPVFPTIGEPITIGDYAWIATGAILLPGVTIGTGAVVGAGAVVTKDVPDYSICVGNPGRLLARKRPSDLRYSPIRMVALVEAWLGSERQEELELTESTFELPGCD